MDISYGDQKIKVNIFKDSKIIQKEESCYMIEIIDEPIESDFFSNPIDDNKHMYEMIMVSDPTKVPTSD